MSNKIPQQDAEALKKGAFGFFNFFKDVSEEMDTEIVDGESLTFSSEDIAFFESPFSFLVGRNMYACHDKGLLDAAYRVELAFNSTKPYIPEKPVPVVISYDAFWVFTAGITALFIKEVKAGNITIVQNDGIDIEEYEKFCSNVPKVVIDLVRIMEYTTIAEIKILKH